MLDDVGLEVECGRILGVVGELGCGKSTLIRAIMGILPKGARVEQGEIAPKARTCWSSARAN